MYLSKASKTILLYYILIAVFWVVLFIHRPQLVLINYLYQFAFGLIPLIGGISGIIKSKEWGYTKSKVGAAIFFISCGLVSWGIGQMMWSLFYNIYLKVEIPYPSFADLGYIMAVPLWAIGMVLLSQATGAKISLKNKFGKIVLLIIPLVLIVLSYYLLVILARAGLLTDLSSGYLKVFFDLAYPLGDIVILTLAVVIYGLSFNYLGGRYKISIIILLLGFIVQYLADFSFSYATTTNTYYNGHWVDLLFPTAMAMIAFGINNFTLKK